METIKNMPAPGPGPNETPEYLTIDQVAQRFGVRRRMLKRSLRQSKPSRISNHAHHNTPTR
jgi:hypothetical protein